MLRLSFLLCCLVALAAAARPKVTFNCGGSVGRKAPCVDQDETCETECQTTEFCQRFTKSNKWFCNKNPETGTGCCEKIPRFDAANVQFDCVTRECNSDEYCLSWHRGSKCVDGCCTNGKHHFETFDRSFNNYTCDGHPSTELCGYHHCKHECHTTQHCQRINLVYSYCSTEGCCFTDSAFGYDQLCAGKNKLECNSHAFCAAMIPDSKCEKGCCSGSYDASKTTTRAPTTTTPEPTTRIPESTTRMTTTPEPTTTTPETTTRTTTTPKPTTTTPEPTTTLKPITTTLPPITTTTLKPTTSKPRRGGNEVTYCKDLHADIVLVIDASGSITAPVFHMHTKRFAKAIIDRFDVSETRTRIGIVAYSATVYYQLPLTECGDTACLLSAIDALTYAAGGTCTGDGIAAATEMLQKSEPMKGEISRSRAIIVITDGNEECGLGPSTVSKRSNEARGLDIDLYAVAVGTKLFYTKAAGIADLDAISGGEASRRFVVENYEALDKDFVEKLQRQVCSTTWEAYGRCEKNECYRDSFCDKLKTGFVCRGGCCVDSKIKIPDPVITNECTFVAADVILVIDGSGSITAPVFHKHTKSFVKELISRFSVGYGRTRIGIVAYSSTIYATVSLDECDDQSCLISKIDTLAYPSAGTCTGDGIATATGMFELASTNEKTVRPKVIIVITDGNEECGPGPSTVSKRSEEARKAGISMFAVAVGIDTFLTKPAAIADLKAISNNQETRQFIAKDYASLDFTFVDELQKEVCTTTTTEVIEKGETCEVECRTTAYCRRKNKNTECSNGCCVKSTRGWDDKKIIRPPRSITYCYGLHADIVLVIDASGSITAPIFNAQTKMFAKSLVGRFDVGPRRTRIGIVAYAASVYYTQDVTECYDINCLYAKIDQLTYPAGGTCTGDAIAKATDLLNNAKSPNFYERNRAKVIIVITDGHEECGSGASTVPARCDAAREDDIELYAIAVGDTFRNKPAAIADLNAISNKDENNKFLATDYNALDTPFIERVQREVCSTEFRRWGREDCESECRTDASCGKRKAGSVCRKGCCVAPSVDPTPITPIFVAECKYVNADIVLVIDASGSITAPIFNTHTKNFAKELIGRFVVSPTKSRIGLVAYAASVYSTTAVTACKDGDCLKDKIDTLNYPAGGTCTGDAIAKATELLLAAPSPDGQERPRVIIVITDGHEECGKGGSTVPKQCDAAREYGIELFAVAAAAIADLKAISDGKDDHKFIAKDYASLDYAFVDDLQREVCSTTVKTGLGDDECKGKVECNSNMQCAFFAPGTKCLNGCCRVPVDPVTGGGETGGCGDKKPRAWCRKRKDECTKQLSMRTECGGTCGYCDGSIPEPKPKCLDKKPTSWCKANTGKCHQARMRCNCAASCGYCGGPTTPAPITCYDTTSDCVPKKHLCLNTAYKSLMLQHCPNTCGWCAEVNPPLITSPPIILPPTTTVPTTTSTTTTTTTAVPPTTTQVCVDIANDCRIPQCTQPIYKELMMRKCKKTCGWC